MVDDIQINPYNLSKFEQERLIFFLSQSNLSDVLGQKNLTISWILFLITLKLKGTDNFLAGQLVSKVTKPSEVAELLKELDNLKESKKLNYLDVFSLGLIKELKKILKHNQFENELVNKFWQLLIQFIIDNSSELSEKNWENILLRIKQSHKVDDILDEVVEYLRPRLIIQKNYSKDGQKVDKLESLILTDFRNQWFVVSDEFIQRWINSVDKATTYKLLQKLSGCLVKSLEIAVIAGEELKNEDGKIDIQVRSVAKHKLNTNRTGFFTIVRVIADVWRFFAVIDPNKARNFVNSWMESEYRLMRRLALFASAEKMVSEEIVCQILTNITSYEFFLASSSVEVYRLIDARWKDLSIEQREKIEKRIVSALNSEFVNTEHKELMDSLCFNLLGYLERIDPPLSDFLEVSLKTIKESHPEWEFFPKEYAGFHYRNYSENPEPDLVDIEDEESVNRFIIGTIESGKINHWILERNWRNICIVYPLKTLRALIQQLDYGNYLTEFWSIFLSNVSDFQKFEIDQVLNSIEKFPVEIFDKLRIDIAQWLAVSIGAYTEIDGKFWKIFNLIAEKDQSTIKIEPVRYTYRLTNTPFIEKHSSVFLAEILIQIFSRIPVSDPVDSKILENLKLLLSIESQGGHPTRVKLAKFLPTLFNRFPDLVRKEIIPLFDWDNDKAEDFWMSQLGNEGLFSQELFELLKSDFVQISDQQKKVNSKLIVFFAKQLISMAVSNQSCNRPYAIDNSEIRKLLKDSGKYRLPIFANEFLNVLKDAQIGDRSTHWETIVGPVYKGIWPLDKELRTPKTSQLLIELICESKTAFRDAYSIVSRFIAKTEKQFTVAITHLSKLDDDCINNAPKEVLDLLDYSIGTKPKSQYFELKTLLNRIKETNPNLEDSMKFQRISRLVSRIPHV